MEEQHYLDYQGQQMSYYLERKPVKNINVHVRRDGTIYASAPRRASIQLVEKLLKAHWQQLLSCAQERIRVQKQEARAEAYGEGEAFFYLGKQYIIRLVQGREQFRLEGAYAYLSLPQVEEVAARQRLVTSFYQQEGLRFFSQRLRALFPYFQTQGVPWPQLRLSWMRTRWGTCNKSRGVVTLSLRLLAHSPRCIDYVIMHELCHFIHFDHSARFHGLMTRLQPDWRQRKQELEDWARLVRSV